MSSFPIPEFLQPVLGTGVRAAFLLYGVGGLLLVALAVGLWLAFGRGPRRRRGVKHVHRLLRQGEWQQALRTVHELQAGLRPGSLWEGRLRRAEGECRRAAGVAAVKAGDYEKGLEHHLHTAALLNLNEAEVRGSVLEHMLGEARRLFAATGGAGTDAVHQMLARVLVLQSPCPEASFWQGLCHIREGKTELALAALSRARAPQPVAPDAVKPGTQATYGYIDPPLYIGGLMLRVGQPKEALLFLTEANRIDGNCPLVTLQLGKAMIESGGDAQIAVRAMQRALGPRGLQLWARHGERMWVEGFPENRSFVRKLAAQHRYVCPLFGADLAAIARDGHTALGQGLYRLGNFQEAADVFTKVMHEAAPSPAVLRGLGLALARLGRYDQAFKHLRTAHELDEGRDRVTAGYLALCGAKGKPARPEDKARNVAWAVRVVSQFSAPGDAEWANLLSQIFEEARGLDLPLTAEDELRLCDQLASVYATDPPAAEAYHHLAAAHPHALRSQHAWLYARAAQQHNLTGPHAVELFARTFAERDQAREYFTARGWDFDAIEYTFLARAAEHQPGRFPEVLGPDYPPRGEAFLLARSAQEEQAGQADATLATAEILHRLAPRSPQAHDRLAQLHYRRGNLGQCWQLLQSWHELEPSNPLPLARLAVVQEQLGQGTACLESIRKALPLAQGRARAEIAFLGARLVLAGLLDQSATWNSQTEALRPALALLDECLRERPDHPQALWVRAAVRQVLGDRAALTAQAPAMNRPDVSDARFHYLAGVCRLAAGDYDGVLDACRRAAVDPTFAVESAYLAGWANIYRRDPAGAAEAFRQTAKAADSPSAGHAQAILGAIRYHEGAYEEAVHWWKALDAERRKAWGFDDALQKTTFMAALTAYEAGRYEQAAERLREANRLGLRDRRLGPLLTLALVKAGQKLLYQE
jgi:tetratricopeptide (TPR) repeat protein